MTLYTLPIPAELNGDQLQSEIGAANLYAFEDKLIIDSDKSEDQVKSIIANHKPIPKAVPTLVEKLAAAGISLEELKAALSV
jgi:hypothetical protein